MQYVFVFFITSKRGEAYVVLQSHNIGCSEVDKTNAALTLINKA
jgi:hypothetical protein